MSQSETDAVNILFATNNAHKLMEVQAVLGPGFRLVTPRECGVTGARMMGGGFGGCTINLVRDELYDRFIATAKEKFNARYGHEPKIYDVVISDGSRRLE